MFFKKNISNSSINHTTKKNYIHKDKILCWIDKILVDIEPTRYLVIFIIVVLV